MKWRDGTEMALVEADDAIGTVAVWDRYQCAVGEPELKIRVACVEISDGGVVLTLQTGNGKSSGARSAMKSRRGPRPSRCSSSNPPRR